MAAARAQSPVITVALSASVTLLVAWAARVPRVSWWLPYTPELFLAAAVCLILWLPALVAWLVTRRVLWEMRRARARHERPARPARWPFRRYTPYYSTYAKQTGVV